MCQGNNLRWFLLRMGQGRCAGEGKLSSTHSCSALILTIVTTVNGGNVSDPGLNLSFSLINISEIVKIVRKKTFCRRLIYFDISEVLYIVYC